jgi:hypothetical protein
MFKIWIPICMIILSISCGRKDPLKGCKSSTTALECEINDNLISADSISASYNVVTRHLSLYFRNVDTSAQALITVFYPLQSLDLPITNKDDFGFGKALTTYGNVSYGVTNGNIKLEVKMDKDTTICGEFFYGKKDQLYVNQGWFSNIPVRTTL